MAVQSSDLGAPKPHFTLLLIFFFLENLEILLRVVILSRKTHMLESGSLCNLLPILFYDLAWGHYFGEPCLRLYM